MTNAIISNSTTGNSTLNEPNPSSVYQITILSLVLFYIVSYIVFYLYHRYKINHVSPAAARLREEQRIVRQLT
jgi:hypothetical protein